MSDSALEDLVSRRPVVELDVELGAEQIDAFREEGFTWIERITTDEELAWLGELYDLMFAGQLTAVRGGYFDLARPYDSQGEDLLPQILGPEALVPDLRKTVTFTNGRRLAAALLGVDAAVLRGWGHMIRKPAHVGGELPWHQDEAYWDPAFDYTALGVWMPLDSATPESGCMSFIPGSHRSEVRKHRHIGDDPAVHGLVTDDVDPALAVAVPLPAGGASFHSCRMLHYSCPNMSDRARRAWANEFQLPPQRREVPYERPWVEEGRREFERRPGVRDSSS